MYICLCKAVSDSTLDAAIEDGATTYRALREKLGVGTCCGKCKAEIKEILDEKIAKLAGQLSVAA